MELLLGICVFFCFFLPCCNICDLQGQRSDLGEDLKVPWLVSLYNSGKNCQGIVLSSWWVLTAANCFLEMIPSHVQLSGSGGQISTVTVSQFVPHGSFNLENTAKNDLALILLRQPLDLQKEYLWPACVPENITSFITQEECKILERSEQGSTQETQVNNLKASECAIHWPGATEDGNFCVERRMSGGTDCVVPIGSPVVCHNLGNGHWEVTAIVTQTLQNCTAPLLASQVSSHLEWLRKQGAIELEDNSDEQSSLSEKELSTATAPSHLTFERGRELSSQPEQTVTSPSRLPFKPTLQTYLVRLITARHSTLGHFSRVTRSSWSVDNVILASPTVQKLLVVMPARKQSVPQTTHPLRTTGQSSVTSPTIVTSTTTQQSSTKQQSVTTGETSAVPSTPSQQSSTASSTSVASSTTAQTTVETTRKQSPQGSPTIRLPHIILIPATTERKSTTQLLPITQQSFLVVSSSETSSTTTQTTVTMTRRQSPQASPSFREPHIIILPATIPRTSSAIPVSDLNQGVPVRFVFAGPQFPENLQEESPSSGPSLASLAPLSTQIPIIHHLGLPKQVKMKQCEIGLAWNSNSHTYQLSRMAILIDRKVGCGLRPGFVPKCPGCSEAEMGEFPWIVSLSLSIQHFCAGSILNRWWILTTANCANLIKNSEALAQVQAGLVDVSKPVYSVQIRQALTHPKSLEHGDLHTLGLLELERPLEFGSLVAPICISEKADMMGEFRDCWLPGWTVLEGGPSVLLRYHIDILNISSCNQLEDKLSNAIFCLKAQMSEEGVCKGDVGSPLICPDPKSGAWLQLGVLIRFDEACSSPYVFSSLPHYLPWLERVTKAEGHRYNLSVPWERRGTARNLRLLREPETLLGWISAQLSLPWQALIATCTNQSCGGSILNRYWVLTTAQCVREANPESTAVFVGLTHPKGHVKGIRVAGIYPYENISQHGLPGDSSLALLLLQKPIGFDKHIARMKFSPTASWDSCKVMGLQMLQSGEVQANPSAYQVKVLLPSDCAKEHPGVKPAMYCIMRDNSSYLPAGAVGKGAALLCHLEVNSTTWSQVGLVGEPFPGSQAIVLSSCITPYVDWIEETSKKAKHPLHLSYGIAPCRPNTRLLLLMLFLFW